MLIVRVNRGRWRPILIWFFNWHHSQQPPPPPGWREVVHHQLLFLTDVDLDMIKPAPVHELFITVWIQSPDNDSGNKRLIRHSDLTEINEILTGSSYVCAGFEGVWMCPTVRPVLSLSTLSTDSRRSCSTCPPNCLSPRETRSRYTTQEPAWHSVREHDSAWKEHGATWCTKSMMKHTTPAAVASSTAVNSEAVSFIVNETNSLVPRGEAAFLLYWNLLCCFYDLTPYICDVLIQTVEHFLHLYAAAFEAPWSLTCHSCHRYELFLIFFSFSGNVT